MRRFPAEVLPEPGEQVLLDETTSHHILRVTLLPRGHDLLLFDGQGRTCQATLVGAPNGQALVEGVTAPQIAPETPSVQVLLGLPRKPALERVLRMATELGMTDFRPFVAQRSVAKGAHPARWTKLVEQAARQCGRSELPTLHPLQPLDRHLEELPPELRRVVLAPGAPPKREPAGPVALVVGPEGGLTSSEIEAAEAAGFQAVGLGTTVLRSDTAVIAALARFTL